MGILKFLGWLGTNAVAVAVAAWIFDGIYFGTAANTASQDWTDKFWPLVFVALIVGIVNSFVKPIINILSIPFIIVTLGLFLLLTNALMLAFSEWIVGLFDVKFTVDGFWTTIGGALVITIVTWIVGMVFGTDAE
ncbi:phage holin family protein [Nocardioides mangrovi]|uniref:Phage holin family protein n=1 Tax=Nocardioides mangrovi TaxID=2874580 RepID=A0ABS7UAI7_9ACTN|nr:phage holin family protein [Nocardioides mangrovi]MBZ5738010.1 phage holin family protein [Nocardioides mangrovi]